jgi:hypothetical protein
MNNSIACTYMGKGFQELFVIWLLHYNVTTVLRMLTKLITLQQRWYSAVNSSLILVLKLLEQCTYLGYFLLEAPRKYGQHGPLLSINWLWLCPQSGACVQSHAVQRRLFMFLMTAAHISPNVFSLRNFLGNVHVLFLIMHSTSFILIIHHIWTSKCSFYYMTNSLLHFFGSS